ncbi:MAG: lysylphosphatidylglycerol synthase transmembrane domain-containing protein, partial [Proteobacteria bacterium]|nr:lysylphosphatidylglycerol synthase transmembrane domain-containing protein [Pseudomonadota bacterium]
MFILLEIFAVAVLALLVLRLAPEPWRGRTLNVLKAWVTVRAFWLLLSHPIALDDGTVVIAWQLIVDQVENIDAATFWTFLLIATGIKAVGMLSSMYRWLLVLRGQGIELPFRHIFGSFLIGRAIGTFLPSTAGLDGYTLYDASRFSGRTIECAAGKALEKVVGFSGIFMTYLVSLPFGYVIFGENAGLFVAMTLPIPLGVIVALMIVLWYPGVIQWVLANVPIPAKARLEGIITRISQSAAAYRDKKGLVLRIFGLSFVVHFTTAAMYFFTALAIGAAITSADFWPVVFGSAIQILATVLSPFTIAGEGIREAAQYVLLGSLIGPAAAIVSAALGFWAAEAPTMLGFVFWWVRGKDYTPAYCTVNGVQVDYEQAAAAALELETGEERARRLAASAGAELSPLSPYWVRARESAGLGLGAGIFAGLLIGVVESLVIAAGGLGGEAQVLWYGPLAYAVLLGGLAAVGGAVLAVLPMDSDDIRGWTPSLSLIATLIPFGLAITVFRLRRDVYLEQMPPLPVLLGVLAVAGSV